ncbi:hypothetical protein MMC11_004344 [Xylographa trunciseda]|nr:hypothetical protein [Xylographa trunciseda]
MSGDIPSSPSFDIDELLALDNLEPGDDEVLSKWSQEPDESPTRRQHKRTRIEVPPSTPPPPRRFSQNPSQECITVIMELPRGPQPTLSLNETLARSQAPSVSVQAPPVSPPLKRRKLQMSSLAPASPGDDDIKVSLSGGSPPFTPSAYEHFNLDKDGIEVLRTSLVQNSFTYDDQMSQAHIPPQTLPLSSQMIADQLAAETEREEDIRAEDANMEGDLAAIITESELRWQDLTHDEKVGSEVANSTQEPAATPDTRTKFARKYEELMASSL